jgi:hypothetical protein
MNPPYCKDGMPRFTEKLIGEFRAGRVFQAIALVHSLTDPFASPFANASTAPSPRCM